MRVKESAPLLLFLYAWQILIPSLGNPLWVWYYSAKGWFSDHAHPRYDSFYITFKYDQISKSIFPEGLLNHYYYGHFTSSKNYPFFFFPNSVTMLHSWIHIRCNYIILSFVQCHNNFSCLDYFLYTSTNHALNSTAFETIIMQAQLHLALTSVCDYSLKNSACTHYPQDSPPFLYLYTAWVLELLQVAI